jgi:hypothetical protein
MPSSAFYLKRLKRLQTLASLTLEVNRADDNLVINSVPFTPIQKSSLQKAELNGKGIMVSSLTADEAKYCELNRISYFTSTGKLRLFKEAYDVTIEPHKKIKLKKHPLLFEANHQLSSTTLISPNGFKILDVLFRLPPGDLRHYTSALSFAKQFSLNQPKLSILMRALKVTSIYDFRKAIAALPDDWWKIALADKNTQKGLTPFFMAAKPHYSLLKLTTREISAELKAWEDSNPQVIPGPLEVAKGFGFLRDEDISLWGTEEALHKLKTKFKLIPGVDKEKPIWQLAVPKYGETPEALSTYLNFSPFSSEIKMPRFSKTNIFRALWDLGFGTERLKELQLSALRGVVNGI